MTDETIEQVKPEERAEANGTDETNDDERQVETEREHHFQPIPEPVYNRAQRRILARQQRRAVPRQQRQAAKGAQLLFCRRCDKPFLVDAAHRCQCKAFVYGKGLLNLTQTDAMIDHARATGEPGEENKEEQHTRDTFSCVEEEEEDEQFDCVGR